MSNVTDQVLDHDYDGIREFDNPLPRWWLWMFYLSIVFAILYIPYYHFGAGGALPVQVYEEDMEAWWKAHPPLVLPSQAEMIALAEQPGVLERGKATYMTYCVACHTADGGGLVGPNFTDDFSIHGQGLDKMAAIVANGVPEKGMIAWKLQLKPDEIFAVTIYVHSLRGTTPANPKAAEGDPIVD